MHRSSIKKMERNKKKTAQLLKVSLSGIIVAEQINESEKQYARNKCYPIKVKIW